MLLLDQMAAFECIICSIRTESKGSLIAHYFRTHKASLGVLSCKKCNFQTRTKLNLIKHCGLKHLTRSKRFRCSLCYYSTRYESCFRSHAYLNHGNDPALMPCTKCAFGASTRALLVEHFIRGKHTFKRIKSPKRLVEQDDRLKVLRCAKCGFTTKWRSSIIHHINSLHNPRLPEVRVKDEPAESPDAYEMDHSPIPDIDIKIEPKEEPEDVEETDVQVKFIRLDKDLNKFFCTECKYSSKRKTSIVAHVNLRHKLVEKFKCTQCSYTTKVKGRLSKHMEKHESYQEKGKKGKRNAHKYKQFVRDSEGLFKCTECDYSTKWRSSIIAHVDNYHNPDAEEYKCQQCSYKTRVKAYLQQHRVTHRIANTTGKKLKRTPRKYKQIVRDTELNMYRCSECEYSTKWRSSIIAHVDNYHNPDAEVYSCSKCSYTCKVKSYLQQHLLTHERGNSTAGRRVTGSSKYKQLSYDNDRDLFTCTDCDYTSKWRGSVIAHIGLRHNADLTLYRCPHCPYSSKVKSYFVQHSRTHDAKPVKCQVCSFVTKNKRMLDHHTRKNHSQDALPLAYGYGPNQLETTVHDFVSYIPGVVKLEPEPVMQYVSSDSLLSEWSEESEAPDINSLEPSIEPSPDLTLAIEMNLNDEDLFPMHYLDHSQYSESVGCPYCAYVSYSREEIYQHMACHQQPIHYYYTTEQPISLELNL